MTNEKKYNNTKRELTNISFIICFNSNIVYSTLHQCIS